MTSLIEIPITKITPHPKNVRRDVAVDDELVNSIKEQGILQPIGVVPAGAKYLLIAGHRRLAAAKKAKLKAVPAIVLEHLDTEASQIEAMLVENGRRLDLSPMEEADAYEQLTLLGVDAAAIATKTGRSTQTVKARLTLQKLPEKARTALHTHAITLDQAALMTKLVDDPKALAKVEKLIGSHNFTWQLESAIRDVEQKAKWAKVEAGFKKRGLVKVKRPSRGWDYENGPCPAGYSNRANGKVDAYYIDQYSGPSEAISQPEPKVLTDEDKARIAEREKADAEAAEAQRQAEAAQALRIKHTVAMSTALEIPKQLLPFFAHDVAKYAGSLYQDHLDEISSIAGVDLPKRSEQYGSDPVVVASVAALSAHKIAALLVTRLATRVDELLEVEGYWRPSLSDVDAGLAHLSWLEETGFTLSDVELGIRKTLDEHRAEILAKAEEKAGAA